MAAVKVREALRLITVAGWYWVRTTGSHRHYKHPVRPGLVTIPGKPGDDLSPKTWESIRRQAGL